MIADVALNCMHLVLVQNACAVQEDIATWVLCQEVKLLSGMEQDSCHNRGHKQMIITKQGSTFARASYSSAIGRPALPACKRSLPARLSGSNT